MVDPGVSLTLGWHSEDLADGKQRILRRLSASARHKHRLFSRSNTGGGRKSVDWTEPITDRASRVTKAQKIIAVLEDFVSPLKGLSILDVGAGSGIVAAELARIGNDVVSVDITSHYLREGRSWFLLAAASALPCRNDVFDIVVCNHILEHVRDPSGVLSEVERVLKHGGYVYLAQDNRLWPVEPHYHLPFLSYLPKRLANRYVHLFRGGCNYKDIQLPTSWELEQWIRERFDTVYDMTERVLRNPRRYAAEDVVTDSVRALVKAFPPRLFEYIRFFLPGWIYVLKN